MTKKIMTVALLAALVGAPAVIAQDQDAEIVIVNQDGEPVEAGQIEVQVDTDESTKFKIEGDKIIIIDESGKTREIDIADARSVSVQQSMKSVDNNGEKKTVTHGKAIIIGPDGEKQVIELGAPIEGEGNGARMMFGGELPKGLFVGDEPFALRFVPNRQFKTDRTATVSKFMIGVKCEPVSEQLRAHLDLDQGVGLIVQSTYDETPAAEAGIKEHDILMFADDTELTSVAELSKVVDRAGQEGKPFSLIAIRGGKEINVEVSPVERPEDQLVEGNVLLGRPEFDMQFRQLGPGVIIGDVDKMELPEDFQKQMDEFRDRIKQMELEMREQMMKDLGKQVPDLEDIDDDNDN